MKQQKSKMKVDNIAMKKGIALSRAIPF